MEKKDFKTIQKRLKSEQGRRELIAHPVLSAFKSQKLERKDVETILGQWYHPLHNFPYFLSSCVSHIDLLDVQTFISDILHEELGCGDPKMAHITLYESTMIDAGYSAEAVSKSPRFESTEKLIEGYKKAAKSRNSALGFLYATEVADLAMVSSIGFAVCLNANKEIGDLPWVDIHVQQEPGHVENVDNSINFDLTEQDANEILSSAKEMWRLWINFFEEIGENCSISLEELSLG